MTSAPNLPRILLGLLFLGGLIAASFWILRPFLLAAIWATMIVVATWPLMRHAQDLLWGRRSLAVLAMVLVLVLAFFVPLMIAVGSVVANADVIASWPQYIASLTIPPPPHWASGLPLVGTRLDEAWRQFAVSAHEALASWLAPYRPAVVRWILAQLGNAGLILVQLILTVIVAAMLYWSGENVAAAAVRFAQRLAGTPGANAVRLAGQAIRGVALGVVVTALIQSALAGISLVLAGVPFPGLLTGISFVFSLAQMGPALVLWIAAGWLYFKGQAAWAVGLFLWGLVVNRVDNVLLPILVKRGADLPFLLIFAGVVGGLLAFGVIGIFIGPVVLTVSYRLLEAWVSGETDETARSAEGTEVRPADGVRRRAREEGYGEMAVRAR